MARAAADDIRRPAYLELVREPDLSVVAFRRLGWSAADYHDWSERLHGARTSPSSLPTVHEGETVTRFAIVNPRTTEADISAILDTMRLGTGRTAAGHVRPAPYERQRLGLDPPVPDAPGGELAAFVTVRMT